MSLPRYPEYKDSGAPWIGNMPSSWNVLPLLAVARERRESNQGMKEDNLLSLSYGRIVRKDMTSNDGLLPESFETYQIVRPGDVVFRLTDLQNDKRSLRTATVEEVGIITSAYLAVEPTGVESRFLSYLLRAYDLSKVFYSMGGGLRQSMKYADVARLPVLAPPAQEQQAIAIFLDRETAKIDVLIAEQEKLLTLLAEKRQATISHAVTRGLDPNAPMKDSGVPWLGEVPAHWEVSPLKYISRIGNGSTPNRDNPDYWSDTGFPWLNSSVVNQDEVTEAERFVTEFALKECHLPVIRPPAVLVGITGQGKTRGMAAPLMFEATISQHLAYVTPEAGRLEVAYLLRVLEIAYGTLRTDSESAGSTKGAITCDQLSRFTIPLPPLDEQGAIAKHIDNKAAHFEKLASDSREAIALLKERRSALIAAAVTGQIDVRGFVEAQAA